MGNTMVLALLRSPLARLFGGLCDLELIGRRSDRAVLLPVQYAARRLNASTRSATRRQRFRRHVIVGVGQVGRHLAELLETQGHDVTVVTRSGSGPKSVTRIAADATDRGRRIETTKGADALHNVAAPVPTPRR